MFILFPPSVCRFAVPQEVSASLLPSLRCLLHRRPSCASAGVVGTRTQVCLGYGLQAIVGRSHHGTFKERAAII